MRYFTFYLFSLQGDYDPDTCLKGYLVHFRDLQRHSLAALNGSGIHTPEELDRRIAGALFDC